MAQPGWQPRAFRYVRILTAVQTVRLAGLLLFVQLQVGNFPAYFAIPFGLGDAFIGVTAIPLAYLLRRGGIRTYALLLAWNIEGLADLLYAIAVASYGGLTQTIMTNLPSVLVVAPSSIVLHVVLLYLLLTRTISNYFTRSRAN